MKKHILSTSLLISTALVLPALAIAMPANTGYIAPADMRTTPAPNTLQKKIHGPDGELLATQPGEIELNRGSSYGLPNTVILDPVNTGNVTPADMRTTPAPNTLRAKIQGPDGELLATQPGEVEINQPGVLNLNTNQPINMQHSSANYQPLIIGEVYNASDVTPADKRITAVPITLQSKVKGPRGELLATQPGEVEVSESRRFVVR